MFALWLRSLTVLCLSRAAFSSPDKGQLVQKTIGDSITIKCRVDVKDQDSLNIKRGLFQTDDIFSTNEKKWAISKEFNSRLEFNIQAFPSVNITINNLTIEDTGPYWCIYTKIAKNRANNYGSGSLLLVVKEKEQCTPEDTRLVLGSLVGMAVLLLVTVMFFLICNVYKTKSRKATRMISNDVYEDMRGTLRR